jgi:hypothetical protein
VCGIEKILVRRGENREYMQDFPEKQGFSSLRQAPESRPRELGRSLLRDTKSGAAEGLGGNTSASPGARGEAGIAPESRTAAP